MEMNLSFDFGGHVILGPKHQIVIEWDSEGYQIQVQRLVLTRYSIPMVGPAMVKSFLGLMNFLIGPADTSASNNLDCGAVMLWLASNGVEQTMIGETLRALDHFKLWQADINKARTTLSVVEAALINIPYNSLTIQVQKDLQFCPAEIQQLETEIQALRYSQVKLAFIPGKGFVCTAVPKVA
jgi:hypothetical protein